MIRSSLYISVFVTFVTALLFSACGRIGTSSLADLEDTLKDKEFEHYYEVTADAAFITLKGGGSIAKLNEEGEVFINGVNKHQSIADFTLEGLSSDKAIVSLKSFGLSFSSHLQIEVIPRTKKEVAIEGIPGYYDTIYKDVDIPVTKIKVKFVEKINGKVNREKELDVDPKHIELIHFSSGR